MAFTSLEVKNLKYLGFFFLFFHVSNCYSQQNEVRATIHSDLIDVKITSLKTDNDSTFLKFVITNTSNFRLGFDTNSASLAISDDNYSFAIQRDLTFMSESHYTTLAQNENITYVIEEAGTPNSLDLYIHFIKDMNKVPKLLDKLHVDHEIRYTKTDVSDATWSSEYYLSPITIEAKIEGFLLSLESGDFNLGRLK